MSAPESHVWQAHSASSVSAPSPWPGGVGGDATVDAPQKGYWCSLVFQLRAPPELDWMWGGHPNSLVFQSHTKTSLTFCLRVSIPSDWSVLPQFQLALLHLLIHGSKLGCQEPTAIVAVTEPLQVTLVHPLHGAGA